MRLKRIKNLQQIRFSQNILFSHIKPLHEVKTYFLSSHRHSTLRCLSFDVDRHLNLRDAFGDHDLNAACEQPAVTPY
jgi:hypothetical protein